MQNSKWVAVDPEKLKQTLNAYEEAKKLMAEDGFSLKDALRMQLAPEKLLDVNTQEIDCGISNGKWLKSVIQKMLNPELITSVKPGSQNTTPKGFVQNKRQISI